VKKYKRLIGPSIDTKNQVKIGSFSRGGVSRMFP